MNFSRLFRNTLALSINTAIAPFLYLVALLATATLVGAALPMDELTAEIFGAAIATIWSIASIHYVGTVARGGTPSLVGSFVVGIYRLPGFLCAVLIVWLMTTFGLLCLIAPGLYALCRWGIAPILLASEGLGVSAAFDRADELTAGFRLQIFGLFASWWVTLMGLQFAAMGAIMFCLENFGTQGFAFLFLLPILGLALQWLSLVGVTVLCDELDYATIRQSPSQ